MVAPTWTRSDSRLSAMSSIPRNRCPPLIDEDLNNSPNILITWCFKNLVAPSILDLHYNPGVKLHHELRGVAEYTERLDTRTQTPRIRISFICLFFIISLLLLGPHLSPERLTDKIIFLIPLFDCFITWVTQSKGSRGPMHSRHYAGNLFSLALAPIPIMHVWCLAFYF